MLDVPSTSITETAYIYTKLTSVPDALMQMHSEGLGLCNMTLSARYDPAHAVADIRTLLNSDEYSQSNWPAETDIRSSHKTIDYTLSTTLSYIG